MAVTLVNTDTIFDLDDPSFDIDGAAAAETLTLNGRTFLYVAAPGDDAVSVFEVSAAGILTKIASVHDADDPNFLFNNTDVGTVVVGGQPFVFATGVNDDGISGFVALANGALVSPAPTAARPLGPANQSDAGSLQLQLNGARDVVAATVGGNTYLFVASLIDDGIEVLSVAIDGTIDHAHSVDDADGLDRQLNGVYKLATTTVGGTTYLFAAGQDDSGISVFSVAATGVLTHVDSVDDSESPSLQLNTIGELATAVVGAKTFLFAAGRGIDNGISVFEVAGDGALQLMCSTSSITRRSHSMVPSVWKRSTSPAPPMCSQPARTMTASAYSLLRRMARSCIRPRSSIPSIWQSVGWLTLRPR